MPQGLVFDIKELALNDGPGSRVTVFLKGCPLRCLWCHNPEGQSFAPARHPVTRRGMSRAWEDAALAEHLGGYAAFFLESGGGVTFSGGEPLAQSEFLFAVVERLPDIHTNLDTSGFAEADVFDHALDLFDLFYFDVKGVAPDLHRHCTGVDNSGIIRNLRALAQSGKPFHIRVPLIPELTDTRENLRDLAALIRGLGARAQSVDLLPINRLAGGKYSLLDREYPLAHSRAWIAADCCEYMRTLLPDDTITLAEQ